MRHPTPCMSENDYRVGEYYDSYGYQQRRQLSWWAWLLLLSIGAILIGGGYYLWRLQSAPLKFSVPPKASPEPPAPKAAEKPPIRHPVPESDAAPDKPLPPLEESDSFAGEILAGLLGQEAFKSFIESQNLINRIVGTVDHLPRRVVPVRISAMKPLRGKFVPEIENRARYALHVRAFESLDARALVQSYVKLYPLFQSAYAKMGVPDAYFNDRLVEAIDDMLAAPELATQPELVQPKVFWRYADPDLEQRSAGQKILMRLGGENAAKVKAKLREIRSELLTQGESRKAKGESS